MSIAEQIGNNLRSVRARRDLSQEALADITGLDRGYISDVERGKRDIRLSTMVKLAKALKCPLANLMEDVSTKGRLLKQGYPKTKEG